MVRRSVLFVLVVMLSAGCALRPPSAPASARPSATGSAQRSVLRVGSDETATGGLIAQLYAQVLAAKGVPTEVASVAGEDLDVLVPEVTAGRVAVAPVFARTACEELSVGEAPPDLDGVVDELAGALDGEVAVLKPAAVRGDPIYVTTGRGVTDGLSALPDLRRLKATARLGLPARLAVAPTGPTGLQAAYGVHLTSRVIDDSAARVAALRGGSIQVAAFEATDPEAAAPDLRHLADPDGLLQPDPLVALIAPGLAGDRVIVGSLQSLHAVLTTQDVARMRERAGTLGVPAAVAEWLKDKGLGG